MAQFISEINQGSIVVLIVSYTVMIAFSLYGLYLSWKQSKVKETTQKLVIIEANILKVLKRIEKRLNNGRNY